MGKGRCSVICDVLEIEYGIDVANEVIPMLAELNDKFEPDNLAVGLLPSRTGTRIVLLRFDKSKPNA